jgi:hypothetical protein
MKNRITKLVEKFIKESFVDITDMEVDEVMDEIDAVNEIETNEDEMEEGNAFTGALNKAKEEGRDSFEIGGKTIKVKEMGESKKSKPDFLDLDKDGNKKETMKKAAKDAKHESVKNKVVFTESELIKFIERIVEAETKVDKNTTKSMSQSKKINSDAVTDTVNKMKEYMKEMGMEYSENTDKFPTGNKKMSREGEGGKEITDDVKKMYTKSDAVEEYIDAFAYPGQTNIVYDEIKPNDEMIEKYLKGDSTTGNAQVDKDGNALGNVVPSETGEKFYKNYEENLYGAEQRNASYKRVPQPVEMAGEGKTKGGLPKSQKIFDKLQSESVKDKKVLKDIETMKSMINYGKKTQ